MPGALNRLAGRGKAEAPPAIRLDPAFLRRLDRLRLRIEGLPAGRPGETPVRAGDQAAGLEVAAHRPYEPGDDLRHLDWNAYGRLDQLLVKRFRAEREVPVSIALDLSASMLVPPADRKLEVSRLVALGLAYIALRQRNPVSVVALSALDGPVRCSRVVRHPLALPRMVQFLDAARAGGTANVAESLRGFLPSVPRRGALIVLSDFLVPRASREALLDALAARGLQCAAVRVIGANEEQGEGVGGRVRLRDSETGESRFVRLTAAHRERYRRAVAHHLRDLEQSCLRRGLRFAVARTEGGLTRIFEALVRAGLLG